MPCRGFSLFPPKQLSTEFIVSQLRRETNGIISFYRYRSLKSALRLKEFEVEIAMRSPKTTNLKGDITYSQKLPNNLKKNMTAHQCKNWTIRLNIEKFGGNQTIIKEARVRECCAKLFRKSAIRTVFFLRVCHLLKLQQSIAAASSSSETCNSRSPGCQRWGLMSVLKPIKVPKIG